MGSFISHFSDTQKRLLGLVIVVALIVAVGAMVLSTKHNADWTPQSATFDGVDMVLVPAGCLMMGNNDRVIADLVRRYDMNFFVNQSPQTKVCFDAPFWIDRYEVTNAQFRQFDGVAAEESRWTGDNRPRETITWFEARDFCLLRGARLPSEAEWEYAARGWDAWQYPWGNDWIVENAVWDEWEGYDYPQDPDQQTADVGSKPDGASWVGALDMLSNVWEWTSSLDVPYPYNRDDGREDSDAAGFRIVRGGSWAYLLSYVWSSYRIGMVMGGSDTPGSVGFRCVRAADEADF